ncbi:hypothetical protein PRUB_a1944 [Pseudoalteromonas rubra]|uniref:Uncharacterized protein n=1 Tax=Pseudoalteromonas rubra TaxID=43658 RepID=A0A8T0CDM9_9GAMM|nr:hypothetical protein PRUB_a1944 [Pseudoalteromonas rubra]
MHLIASARCDIKTSQAKNRFALILLDVQYWKKFIIFSKIADY